MLDEIVGRAARYLPAAGGRTEEPEQTALSPVIDRKAIERATQTLQDYKKGKASLESRIVEEERWWRQELRPDDRQGGPARAHLRLDVQLHSEQARRHDGQLS